MPSASRGKKYCKSPPFGDGQAFEGTRILESMQPHPLTPIENDIIVEICRFLALRGEQPEVTEEVIGILGCWGDSLPEEDILSLLRAVNSHTSWHSRRF